VLEMPTSIYTIYKHTSPSGKSYIGMTKNIKRRNSQHQSVVSSCTYFSNAVKKYGWDNFIHELLGEYLSFEEANECEVFMITEHTTLAPFGYNLKRGGSGICSDITKIKMSKARLGWVPSTLTKKKMSEASKGKKKSDCHRAKLVDNVNNPTRKLKSFFTLKGLTYSGDNVKDAAVITNYLKTLELLLMNYKNKTMLWNVWSKDKTKKTNHIEKLIKYQQISVFKKTKKIDLLTNDLNNWMLIEPERPTQTTQQMVRLVKQIKKVKNYLISINSNMERQN
jgi:group I intron endonuclease